MEYASAQSPGQTSKSPPGTDQLTLTLVTISTALIALGRAASSAAQDFCWLNIYIWTVTRIFPINFILWFRVSLIGYVVTTPYLRWTLNSCREALARNGPDDETVTDCMYQTLHLVSYLSTWFVACNFSMIISFWKACIPWFGGFMLVGALWLLRHRIPVPKPVRDLLVLLAIVMLSGLVFVLKIIQFSGQEVLSISLRIIKKVVLTSCRTYYKFKIRIFGDGRPAHWGQPFSYEALSDTSSIRLLRISRQGLFEDFTCEIVHTTIGSSLRYEAISYTWGDLLNDQDLMVNGRIMKVTSRVMEIVQARASFFDEKLLWIDSVCINQADLIEKVSQIRIMSQIFHAADRVLLWLGFAANATVCNTFLLKLVQKSSSPLNDHDFKRILGIGAADLGWQAFFEFLEHPYWSRAWIVQELAVAKNIVVSYGGEYLGWEMLDTFFTKVLERNVGSVFVVSETDVTPKTLHPPGALLIPVILALRKRYQAGGNIPFENLITGTQMFKAKDPRDKIYSLLAFSSAVDEPLLSPDYTKSVSDLWIDVARFCFTRNPFGTLAAAGIGARRSIEELPSWTPDYASSHSMLHLSSSKSLANNPSSYRASGNSALHCNISPQSPILMANLINFDSIAHLGPICPTWDMRAGLVSHDVLALGRDNSAIWLAMHEFAFQNMKPGSFGKNGQSRDEVIWRTLIGDRGESDGRSVRPAPAEYGDYYTSNMRFARMIIRGTQIENLERLTEIVEEFKGGVLSPRAVLILKYHRASAAVTNDRRLAVTHAGHLAVVPPGTAVGDVISIMQGHPACLLMRPRTSPEFPMGITGDAGAKGVKADRRFVGEAYVHGFMDGEALDIGEQWEEAYIW